MEDVGYLVQSGYSFFEIMLLVWNKCRKSTWTQAAFLHCKILSHYSVVWRCQF